MSSSPPGSAGSPASAPTGASSVPTPASSAAGSEAGSGSGSGAGSGASSEASAPDGFPPTHFAETPSVPPGAGAGPQGDRGDLHSSVYDGLLASDDSQWAFGTDFEDPLAGIDTTIADDIDAAGLARYCLMLGDDALIYSHRLAEWTSRAPDLEDDIALANIALDLLGQGRLLLARAAAADPIVVPRLPPGSPVPPEDALAFFRDESAFTNVRLVEAVNGDFAVTIVRLLIFSTHRLAVLSALCHSNDAVLAAIAVKGVKEVTYHRDYAGRWFLTLARGTEESRQRLVAGLELVWPWRAELRAAHAIEKLASTQGFGVDPASVADEVDVLLEQVFALSGVVRPDLPGVGAVAGGTGRDGRHSEAMGRLLAEMQAVARAHPEGLW